MKKIFICFLAVFLPACSPTLMRAEDTLDLKETEFIRIKIAPPSEANDLRGYIDSIRDFNNRKPEVRNVGGRIHNEAILPPGRYGIVTRCYKGASIARPYIVIDTLPGHIYTIECIDGLKKGYIETILTQTSERQPEQTP